MTDVPELQGIHVNRCVIQKGSLLLLVQRSKNDSYGAGLWELPGGKMDAGESFLESLGREVLEETGLTIETTIPAVYSDSFTIENGKYKGTPYEVVVSIGSTASGEVYLGEEHDDYTWDSYDVALTRDMTPESEKALRFLGSLLVTD